MKIGFIGAGRVGCSIGKYLKDSGKELSGYYDISQDAAQSAAAFTGSSHFAQLKDLVLQSTLLFLTTPDGIIESTWNEIRTLPLTGRIICHCSGALPSDAFTGIEQLKHSFFTIEGQETAVQAVSNLFTSLGNTVSRIKGGCKPKYHAAASILSNQVIAVLDTGYRLLEECGFSRESAVKATRELVLQNIDNVLLNGCSQALTGPIERNDIQTVQKHLSCLEHEDRQMYRTLGLKLIQIAEKKNPQQDYSMLYKQLANG